MPGRSPRETGKQTTKTQFRRVASSETSYGPQKGFAMFSRIRDPSNALMTGSRHRGACPMSEILHSLRSAKPASRERRPGSPPFAARDRLRPPVKGMMPAPPLRPIHCLIDCFDFGPCRSRFRGRSRHRIGHAMSATGHGAPCGALPGRRRSTAVTHHERGGKDDLSPLGDIAALDPVHEEADQLVDHLHNRMFGAR